VIDKYIRFRERLEKIFLATQLCSTRRHHSLFSPLEIDPFGWNPTLIFVSNAVWVCIRHTYVRQCVEPVTSFILPSCRSSHEINNQYMVQVLHLTLSRHLSLVFPLTRHSCNLLSGTQDQDVWRGWVIWKRTCETNQTDHNKWTFDCWFNYLFKKKLVMQKTVM
jgi:hypothetical protein